MERRCRTTTDDGGLGGLEGFGGLGNWGLDWIDRVGRSSRKVGKNLEKIWGESKSQGDESRWALDYTKATWSYT